MSVETELRFEDATPPETLDYSGGGKDASPALDDAPSCRVCGKTLTYAGRGRKPVYCDDHKKSAAKGAAKTIGTVRVSGNEKLAEQAAKALVQINNLTGLGARIAGLHMTAEMIGTAQEGFYEQAYTALLTDPALCKQILSAGEISGKFSLAIAYAMMGSMVMPVAVMEIKAKREARKDAENDEDDARANG